MRIRCLAQDSCSSVDSRSVAMLILYRLSSSSSSSRCASARCKRSFNNRSDSSNSLRTRSICRQDRHAHRRQFQTLSVAAEKIYTVSQKKVPTFKLSVILSNLNRFSKFLHCKKAYEICYKTVRHYAPHLKKLQRVQRSELFLRHSVLTSFGWEPNGQQLVNSCTLLLITVCQ